MSRAQHPAIQDDKFVAVVDLLGRTGAKEFQIRYCEEDEPTVWIACAQWPVAGYVDDAGKKHRSEAKLVWQAAGGMTPWSAVFRLAEATMDGGHCVHCNKMTAVDDKPPDVDLLSVGDFVCFYRYDPELKTFRRSCEGVSPRSAG